MQNAPQAPESTNDTPTPAEGETLDELIAREPVITPEKIGRAPAQNRALKRLVNSKLTPAVLEHLASHVPEQDPGAVNMAAKEIYARLPGRVIAKLQSIVAYNGQNRYARRATASILKRYFKGEAANRQKYAARKASEKNAKINPSDRGPLRAAAEYEAQLAAGEVTT